MRAQDILSNDIMVAALANSRCCALLVSGPSRARPRD
jgi:hypothetical protein